MRKKFESVMLMDMQNELFEELRSQFFYQILFQLVSSTQPRHILEIGGGEGLGSTRILSAALSTFSAPSQLYCIEADFKRAEHLRLLYPEARVLHGLSDNQVEMPTAADVLTFYQQNATHLRRYPLDQVLSWLAEEEGVVQQLKHQTSGLEQIKQEIEIAHFDLVLLDGGEFSGASDLALIYGAKVIILDDIMTYKNWNNHRFLKQDPNYYMLYEFENWAHGCSAFIRRPVLKPGIGAVIHTLNAEAQIENCLESLAWVDKVWVIDMYSQDQTVDIARGWGAEVISHLPTDCVDRARNFGLAQVDREWTLVLDVDERLPESLAQTIQTELKHMDKTGYWVPRQNFFFGEPIAALFPDYQMRFFRSQQALWSGRVHEHPYINGDTTAFPAELPYAIRHQAYDSLSQFANKQLTYAQLSNQQSQAEYSQTHQAENVLALRQQFTERQQLLNLKGQEASHQTWLIQQLYLFSDLSNLAVKMLASGQFKDSSVSQKEYRLSAFSYLKNGVVFDYPFIESLLSIAPICDQIIVCYASESTDGSREALEALQAKLPQLELYPSKVWQTPGLSQGEVIRLAAEEAEAYCDGDWLLHLQADEVYLNAEVLSIKNYLDQYHCLDIDGFFFQVLHFYADYDMVIGPQGAKAGWYQETMRLSRAGKAKHIQDAWTQLLKEPQSKALRVPIRIFHYGHVREKEAMRLKASYMERLYHDLADDYEVCAAQAFEYNAVPKELIEPFDAEHPETMLKRISSQRLAHSLHSWSMTETRRQKPRLLVIGRYPGVKKGYGITFDQIYQTGYLQESFEVHHLAWHYSGPNKLENGIYFYSDSVHAEGGPGALRGILYEIEPDLILLHADPHFFIPYQKELKAWKGPVVGWFTIDYERISNPDPLVQVFNRCQRLIALADFGRRQMKKDYTGTISKVPLSVDTQLFHPVDAQQKQLLRKQFALPEQGFIFLMVANNFWRKGIEYALQAMATYHQSYGVEQPVYLYLHTERTPELIELVQGLGLQNWVIISPDFDPYKNPWSDQKLAQLYQACNAFLLTSLGEGFGMPIWEAQASALPVIVSENSVLPEVAGPDALFIPCPGWAPGLNGDRMVWMKSPDPEACARLMFQLLSDSDLYWRLATESLKKVYRYTWQDCALKLRTELALALGTGKLEYYPAEPDLYLL